MLSCKFVHNRAFDHGLGRYPDRLTLYFGAFGATLLSVAGRHARIPREAQKN